MVSSVKVMGVDIYPYLSFDELIDDILPQKKMLLSVNAEVLLKADQKIRSIYNSNIGYPDGMGAVFALRKLGLENVVKLPGCELWLKIIEKVYHTSVFYLIGGSETVIQETVSRLKEQYNGIRIAGYRNGYIEEKEYDKLINDVVACKPDFVFVAMGMPKQELLMYDLYVRHKAIYLGLGGSFDVYSGYVKRAPKWWVNNNLEFAYRLIKQPSRISRQVSLIKFFFRVISGKI